MISSLEENTVIEMMPHVEENIVSVPYKFMVGFEVISMCEDRVGVSSNSTE